MLTPWRLIARAPGAALAVAFAAGALTAGVLMVGCENSDPTAPEGSMITVSADPQTVLPGQISTITATLRSSNGTRLPDQEVLFSTTAGALVPKAQTAILTNDAGQAVSDLITPASATVTATSGSVSGNTSVTVSGCALSGLTLQLNPQTISSCATEVDVTVTAIDTNGDPCEDLIIRIRILDPLSGETKLPGNLNATSGVTSDLGEFATKFIPDNTTCLQDCRADPNQTGNCEVDFLAEDSSGSINSGRVTLGENIP